MNWRRPRLLVSIAALLAAMALAALLPGAQDRWQRVVALVGQTDARTEQAQALDPGDPRVLLRYAVERNPRDGRGWVLLAYAEMEAQQFGAAVAAFEKAVAVSWRVAADPAVWCEYADAAGMAQGGSLAGRPTELVMHALALRADHPKALEMAGSAAYERRDFSEAVRFWRQLLPQLTPQSQAQRELTEAIARAERRGKVELPP